MQAQSSAAVNIEARAADRRGISRISFYIDNLLVQEFEAGALPEIYSAKISYNAPEQAGVTLKIKVTAKDEAGNEGSAFAEILIVEAPDIIPPVIEAVHLPKQAAPGDSVTMRCDVRDERGVEGVSFSSTGISLGYDSLPPYEINFTIPSNALIGSIFTVDVEAEDNSGNKAEAQASLEIVAVKDTTPPTGVSIQAPAVSLAGQTIQLNASAVDDVGILKVVFYADGEQIAEDTSFPYSADYKIPGTKPAGSQVVFTVEAIDYSSNKTKSAPAYTKIIAPGEGYILGEVYDDTLGLPVSGASVKVISANGKLLPQPVPTVTDLRGRYAFLLDEGGASLEITQTGFTSVYRTINVQGSVISYPLDARLTPTGNSFTVSSLTGGSININENQISLYVPPGALAENAQIKFTTLSGQGLPGILPAGWTPVAAILATADGNTPNSALELTIRGLQNTGSLIAVQWDNEKKQWVRIETGVPSIGEGIFLLVNKLGTFALVKPDAVPEAPVIPAIGTTLAGVALQAIPEGITAKILPNPEIIFMQPGAKSEVWAALNNKQPLPSGTVIQVDFSEAYERTNGSILNPESMTQDFILYQGSTGFESHFIASPGELFDPILLKEGVIKLDAHRPEGADGSGIIGPAGGTVSSPDGFSITIPAGALNKSIPVLLNGLPNTDTIFDGVEFIRGIEISLAGNTLATSAVLNVSLVSPLAQDAQVLVVKAVRAEGITRYELTGIATVNGNKLTAASGGLGLPLPGILEEGRYYFLRMVQPVGYATGLVQTSQNGIVNNNTLPFINIINAARSSYVQAALIGNAIISAKDLSNGSSGSENITLTEKNQIIIRDISLTESRPTVIAVSPNDNATGVQTTVTVSVKFSRAMNADTINASTFIINDGTANVAGTISLLPDKTTAVFQPKAPFADSRLYRILLSAQIQNTFGKSLFGNQSDGSFASQFTIVDVTPPPPPPAGNISVSLPDNNGFAVVFGTQGTVNPDDRIVIINETTNVTASPTVESDGSFSLTIRASLSDTLSILISDNAGNKTIVPVGPMKDTEGRVAVGPGGGEISADGLILDVPKGAFPEGAIIKFRAISESETGVSIPAEFPFITGFELEASVEPKVYLNVSVPLPPGAGSDMKGVVAQILNIAGKPFLNVVDTAKVINGRLTTSSPPCQGVASRLGRYGIYGGMDNRARSLLVVQTARMPRPFYIESADSMTNFPFIAMMFPPAGLALTTLNLYRTICLPLPDNVQQIIIRDAGTGSFIETMPVNLSPGVTTTISYSPSNDDSSPEVTTIEPLNKELNLNNRTIRIRFSEPVVIGNINDLALIDVIDMNKKYEGDLFFSENNQLLTFIPKRQLPMGRQFRLNLDEVELTDLAGNPYSGASILFYAFQPDLIFPRGSTPVPQTALKEIDFITKSPEESDDGKRHTDIFGLAKGSLAVQSSLFVINADAPSNPAVTSVLGIGNNYNQRLRVLKDTSFTTRTGGMLSGWNSRELNYIVDDPSVRICAIPGSPVIQKWQERNGCGTSALCAVKSGCGDLAVATLYDNTYSFVRTYDVTDRSVPVWVGYRLLSDNGEQFDLPRKPWAPKGLGFPRGFVLVPDTDITHESRTNPSLTETNTGTIGAYVANHNIGLQLVDLARNIPAISGFERDAGTPLESMGQWIFTYYNDIGLLGGNSPRVIAISGGVDYYGMEGPHVLEVFTPELSPLSQPLTLGHDPYRLIASTDFPVYNTSSGAYDYHDLIFTTSTEGGISIIEVPDNGINPAVVQLIQTPGRAEHMELDYATKTLYVGAQWDGKEGIIVIDVENPFEIIGDDDGDVWNDRIIGKIITGSLNSFRIDSERGLIYAATDKGLSIIKTRECTDLGIDFYAKPEQALIPVEIERKALQKVITAAWNECGLSGSEGITMIEQGSGACLWKTEGCGSNYQPGISDHDYEVFSPASVYTTDADECLIEALFDQVIDEESDPVPVEVDGYKVTFEDISFFPMVLEEFETAMININPPTTTSGDITGDMGLGRQQLLLKWLTEGAYVEVPGLNLRGKDFAEILRILKQPLDVNGDGIYDEPSHIPRLEGYEWAKLQEAEIYASGALIRISGSADPGTTLYKIFKKDLHKAAKAAIRAVSARIVANNSGNELSVDVPSGSPGCIDASGGSDPYLWPSEECDSFEHYIASTAARMLRDRPAESIFTLSDVKDKIYRFYSVKAGKDKITTEADANAFLSMVLQFIFEVGTNNEVTSIYNRTVGIDPRAAQRGTNMSAAVIRINEKKVNGKKQIIPRVSNIGAVEHTVKVKMYKDTLLSTEEKTKLDAGRFVHIDTRKEPRPQPGDPPGMSRKNVPVFVLEGIDQTGSDNGWVNFLADLPEKFVQERERQNNWAKVYYYVLNASNPAVPTPPSPSLPIPDPDGDMLEGDFACTASSKLRIIQTVNGATDGTVYLNGSPGLISLDVINSGTTNLRNVEIYSSLYGTNGGVVCVFSDLNAGETKTCLFNYTRTTQLRKDTGFIVATALDENFRPIGTVIDANTLTMTTACGIALVEPDPSPNPEQSEVMYGGSFYRYYRVIDRAGGSPVNGATVKATFPSAPGSPLVTQEYITDPDGYIISPGPEKGLAVPWDTWMDGIINSSQTVELEVLDTCAEKVVFGIMPRPFKFSDNITAGAALKLGVEILGGKATLGGNAGLDISMSAERDSSGTSVDKFSISRNIGGGLDLGYEASLIDIGGRIGRANLSLTSKIGAGLGISLSLGDTYEFVNPLSNDDKIRIAGLIVDTALKSSTSANPLVYFMLRYLNNAVTGLQLNNTSTAFKLSGSLGTDAEPFNFRGSWFNYGAEPMLKIGASGGIKAEYSYGSENLVQEGKKVISHGLSGEMNANIGIAGGYFDSRYIYVNDHRRGLQAVNLLEEEVSRLNAKVFNTGLSAGVEFKTTSGANNVPEKLELGISGKKEFGFKLSSININDNVEINTGNGGQINRTYTITNTEEMAQSEIINRMPSFYNLLDLNVRTGMGIAADPDFTLGPTTVFDSVSRFIHLISEDAEYEDGKKTGTGFSFPIKLEASVIGTGIDEASVNLNADLALSYKSESGVLKGAEHYKLEDYSSISLSLASDSIIISEIQSMISYAFSGISSWFHNVIRQFDAVTGRGVIRSQGSAMLTVKNLSDYNAVAGLLSFDYEGISATGKSLHYEPAGVTGPVDKPHYGIGGFHKFVPLAADKTELSEPAELVIDYDDSEISGFDENTLGIYSWNYDRGDWDYIGGSLDTGANTVTAEINKLGLYTLAPVMAGDKINWEVENITAVDGKRRVTLVSSAIKYNNGVQISDGTIFHVISAVPYDFDVDQNGKRIPIPLGDIISADIAPDMDGVQIASRSGALRLIVELPEEITIGLRIISYPEQGTSFSDQVVQFDVKR